MTSTDVQPTSEPQHQANLGRDSLGHVLWLYSRQKWPYVMAILTGRGPPIMYSHLYHTIRFFKNSTLLHPVDVTINCFTFHYVLQLPSADADLYWALGCCFVCGLHGHHSEACPSAKGELQLICDLLEGPFGK